jgi:hypothetical protein
LQWILDPRSRQRAMSPFLRRRAEGPNVSEGPSVNEVCEDGTLPVSLLTVVTLSRCCYSKALSALSASCIKNFSATFCGHPLAEPVCRLATLFTWLIRAFHSVLPELMRGLKYWGACSNERRSLKSFGGEVNPNHLSLVAT